MKYKIHIIDDDLMIRSSLKTYLDILGYDVTTSESGRDIEEKIRGDKPDLILLDLFLPEKNGLEVLKDIMRIDKEMLVILITGYGTVETAVTAMKEGAYDFINKPLEAEKVELIIKKALKTITLKKELSSLHQKEIKAFNENFIIAEDSIMNQILQNMKNAAITDVPILISGESGTGKEILAKAVYFYSKRFSKPFVSINCSAIPTEIVESELFGYEGGSFTGASAKGKTGILEVADGGTIFFDEIGELDLKAQTKLLRFLQEKEIQKVGSTKVKKVDVRVIAATNKDLKYEVGQKTFREDLFYRLNVFNVIVPPLKERREDILPLARYFVKKFSAEFKKEVDGMTEELEQEVLRETWSGNVRELQNAIARSVILCEGKTIELKEMMPEADKNFQKHSSDFVVPLKEMEAKYVSEVLSALGNNKMLTARKLKISVNTLKSIIKKQFPTRHIKK